jgi:hypothetical protein
MEISNMDKIIVIRKDDGGVEIVCPAPAMFDPNSKTREQLREQGIDFANDDEVLQFIINKDVPAGSVYRVVTRDVLPQDRTFRNAWTDDKPTDSVDVDIDKAKEIKKDQLRELRKPRLAELDIQYMKVLEQGQDVAPIVAEKQALRDITKAELPDDIEDLKNHIPDILK